MKRALHLGDLSKYFEDLQGKIIEEQKQAVVNGLIDSIPALIDASPVDTGLYAQSWDLDVTEKRAILGNYAPHAAIIEQGARPFRPPIGPLLRWAKRVLGDPSQPPDYSSEVWALATYTQKKIEERGIEPRNVLENELPNIIRRIMDELDKVKL